MNPHYRAYSADALPQEQGSHYRANSTFSASALLQGAHHEC